MSARLSSPMELLTARMINLFDKHIESKATYIKVRFMLSDASYPWPYIHEYADFLVIVWLGRQTGGVLMKGGRDEIARHN